MVIIFFRFGNDLEVINVRKVWEILFFFLYFVLDWIGFFGVFENIGFNVCFFKFCDYVVGDLLDYIVGFFL